MTTTLNSDMARRIVESLDKVRGEPASAAHLWLHPCVPDTAPTKHHFALFLKPEITATHLGVATGSIVQLLMNKLEEWSIESRAIRVLGGSYLLQHEVMNAHYGVINKVSRLGANALTQQAHDVLAQRFAEDLAKGATVLGAHEFLKAQPRMSAEQLSSLSDAKGSTKLGPGSYCVAVQENNELFLVLNPFHPFQLETYTDSEAIIVVLECSTETPWSDLRTRFAGATNPEKALAGSFRRELLEQQAAFSLAEVHQGANGIHVSAGPVEGMVELVRFLSDPLAQPAISEANTAFGSLLLDRGLSPQQIAGLAENPPVEDKGARIPVFDATEEMDAVPAADIVQRLA